MQTDYMYVYMICIGYRKSKLYLMLILYLFFKNSGHDISGDGFLQSLKGTIDNLFH